MGKPVSQAQNHHKARVRKGLTLMGSLKMAALNEADSRAAESKCPQHLPIGRLMRGALEDFA
jgi:predicted aldo/keto reductase-like oxidoreductase